MRLSWNEVRARAASFAKDWRDLPVLTVASRFGIKPSRLRCMAYSPMLLRQDRERAEQLFEHSFFCVPGQAATLDSTVEHGDVHPSVGRKGFAHRLVRRPEQHTA